jgi:hypothetical protein
MLDDAIAASMAKGIITPRDEKSFVDSDKRRMLHIQVP